LDKSQNLVQVPRQSRVEVRPLAVDCRCWTVCKLILQFVSCALEPLTVDALEQVIGMDEFLVRELTSNTVRSGSAAKSSRSAKEK